MRQSFLKVEPFVKFYLQLFLSMSILKVSSLTCNPHLVVFLHTFSCRTNVIVWNPYTRVRFLKRKTPCSQVAIIIYISEMCHPLKCTHSSTTRIKIPIIFTSTICASTEYIIGRICFWDNFTSRDDFSPRDHLLVKCWKVISPGEIISETKTSIILMLRAYSDLCIRGVVCSGCSS